jgi:HSP20 family protein
MDDVLGGTFGGRPWDGKALSFYSGSWPRTNVVDNGSSIVITAEVPGLSEKDIKLTLTQNVLQISGERKLEVPKGYTIHRQERPELSFSRSFSLPSRVNAESATATVKDGILTITLEKTPDAMPRQITVSAQ